MSEAGEIETCDPKDLRPHPYNARLYRQRTPGQRFIEDVAQEMEEPLVVNEDGEILDGVRRWLAALDLGMDTVEVIEEPNRSYQEEKQAILRHNDDRDETFSQKVRVAMEYEEMIAPLLEERMKAGVSLDEQEDDPILKSDEGATALGLAGDRVGWGKDKYREAKKIWEARESGDNLARQLVRRLDDPDPDDDITVHGAVTELEEADQSGDVPEARGGAAPIEVAREEWDIEEPVRAAFPASVYRLNQMLKKTKPIRGKPEEHEADMRLDIHEDWLLVETVDSKHSFSQEWFDEIDFNVDDGPISILVKHDDLSSRINLFDGEVRVEIRGPEDSSEATHLILADEHKIAYFSNLSEAVTIPGRTIVRHEPLDKSPLSEDEDGEETVEDESEPVDSDEDDGKEVDISCFEGMSKQEIYRMAVEEDISGRSNMSREELARALQGEE